MAAQVTSYQCPACTGPLHFDAGTGKLSCEYCGSSYETAEIEALYAANKAEDTQVKPETDSQLQAPTSEEESQWNLSSLNEHWGSDAENMRAYSCPSCCAELICDETTAATSCPYCGNPTVIPEQFGGTLRPDYVIPFRIKKVEAVSALKKHYKGRPFLPKSFQKENHIQEIKGVYVPFWLFNGEAEGSMTFNGTRSYTYRSGEYQITKTDHFHIMREGIVPFEKIPVDGSTKMPDDYMDSLEPFDYQELTEFSAAYLPGYLADKYDVSAEQCAQRADSRAAKTFESCLKDSVSGYEMTFETGKTIQLHRGDVKYALLPVWILNTKWNGQNWLFAMNGQTGKFVGNLPIDMKKCSLTFAAIYAAAALVTGAIVLFPGGLLHLLGF